MKSVLIADISKTRFDGDFLEFWESGIIGPNVWLAGGAMRSLLNQEKPSDYDLFFYESGDDWMANVEEVKVKLKEQGYKLAFECPEGKMFTFILYDGLDDEAEFVRKVQLICERAYGSLDELISLFDLAPCYAGTDGTLMVYHREFVRATKFKRLHLISLTFPVATMGRIYKYMRKEYDKGEVFTEFCQAIEAGAPWPEGSWRKYID